VGWSALQRLEKRSAVMREQWRTTRAERSGRRSVAVARRGETTPPMDGQHDGVTHRVAAACVARGADVAAGRQRRREVAVAAEQLSRACDSSVQAPAKGAAHRVVAACGARGGWEAGGAR
jgi:hypothetical protein